MGASGAIYRCATSYGCNPNLLWDSRTAFYYIALRVSDGRIVTFLFGVDDIGIAVIRGEKCRSLNEERGNGIISYGFPAKNRPAENFSGNFPVLRLH